MSLRERWRKWCARQDVINYWRARCRQELKERHEVGVELLQAIKNGDLDSAVRLQTKLDLLPCPTCGRNGGGKCNTE